jgi:hypothetical protein
VILSKRERYIVIGTAAVVAILGLDYLVFEPLLASRAEVMQQIDARGQDLADARAVIARREINDGVWKRISPSLTHNRQDAEALVLRAVNTWATETRLSLPSLKSDGRDDKELLPSQKTDNSNPNPESFHKVSFHATGTGPMRTITDFLFKMRNANFPLRITELTISTKKEGTDELTLTIGFTSIYYPTQAERPPGAVAMLSREVR